MSFVTAKLASENVSLNVRLFIEDEFVEFEQLLFRLGYIRAKKHIYITNFVSAVEFYLQELITNLISITHRDGLRKITLAVKVSDQTINDWSGVLYGDFSNKMKEKLGSEGYTICEYCE